MSSDPSNEPCKPESDKELREALLSYARIRLVGGSTKSDGRSEREYAPIQLVSTQAMRGITEYQPSEFVFTAYAGTRLDEITEILSEHRQYLPFDPPLARAGATLGGTVAMAMSGSGRFRFGGVRDFILGADFLTGDGKWIRSGGKVVKNAAGFDLPKLLVGSFGQLAAMTLLTFKVFPAPVERHSFRIECESHQEACERIARLARGRWEFDAIDYRGRAKEIWLRLGTSLQSATQIADDIQSQFGDVVAMDNAVWRDVEDLRFPEADWMLIKTSTRLGEMRELATWCDEQAPFSAMHNSSAGAITWVNIASSHWLALKKQLDALRLPATIIRGSQGVAAGTLVFPSGVEEDSIAQKMKQVFDPDHRFATVATMNHQADASTH
ncbi:MAG: FAD-binding protein [Planctomycetota bacterium]